MQQLQNCRSGCAAEEAMFKAAAEHLEMCFGF